MINATIRDRSVQINLKNRAKKSARTRNLMMAIAGDLESSTEKNFASQGRRPRWEKLKESTLLARARQGKTGKILQVSGILKNSVVSKYGTNFALIGTNLRYARIHQEGGTIDHPGTKKGFGRGIHIPAHKIKIPARPFVKLTKGDTAKIIKRITNWFK